VQAWSPAAYRGKSMRDPPASGIGLLEPFVSRARLALGTSKLDRLSDGTALARPHTTSGASSNPNHAEACRESRSSAIARWSRSDGSLRRGYSDERLRHLLDDKHYPHSSRPGQVSGVTRYPIGCRCGRWRGAVVGYGATRMRVECVECRELDHCVVARLGAGQRRSSVSGGRERGGIRARG
jgi:hypothetical protein